jgi:orotate phosphoribosyltransferase
VEGPARNAFCAALEREKESAGVVVAVATVVVNRGERAPAEKEVTVPVPTGRSAVTSARKVGVAFAPVVHLKSPLVLLKWKKKKKKQENLYNNSLK